MNYTLEEIKKHKIKINDLSNKLINTFDINEEIMINNGIKKETEFLLSLLNIKQNEIITFNNNINNNMNFNMNNNFSQQMNNQQFQFLNAQQQMMNILNGVPNNEQHQINQETFKSVKFLLINQDEQITGNMIIIFMFNDKVSSIIEKYRIFAVDNEPKKFIFNGRELNGDLTAAEAGIYNNAEILVYSK